MTYRFNSYSENSSSRGWVFKDLSSTKDEFLRVQITHPLEDEFSFNDNFLIITRNRKNTIYDLIHDIQDWIKHTWATVFLLSISQYQIDFCGDKITVKKNLKTFSVTTCYEHQHKTSKLRASTIYQNSNTSINTWDFSSVKKFLST